MKLINKLEKKYGRLAVKNLTLIIVISQSLCFILALQKPSFVYDLVLIPQLVEQGQIWRVITFMVVPPNMNPIFAIFAVYIFYLMGTALEEEWGIFQYNLYLFIAYIATLIAVFAGPVDLADNFYIESSVFLAFAYLYPEFEFLLFFVLPVKVKYLALFTWCLYGFQFIFGSNSQQMMILASTINFFIFFGQEIKHNIKNHARQKEFELKTRNQQKNFLHQCELCRITDQDNNIIEFRVCSRCSSGQEYCSNHIHNHEHK